MSSSVPAPDAAPPVDVTLPDGQTLRGRLYERRQTSTGWLYRIGLVLWQSVDPDHSGPGEYRAWMPAARATPVSGVDYAAVPTVRLSKDVPPPASTVQPDPATQWRIIKERHAYDAEMSRTSVHRADCWTVHEKGTVVDSEAEARAAMAEPGARGCTICGTDQSLA